MIVGAPYKVILQERCYSLVRQGIAQEMRNLMSKGLPQLEENLNNQPKGANNAPGLLVSSGEQCHGDQGKGKRMEKLGHNASESSKDTDLPWKIPYRVQYCCTQAAGMCRPAQHILHGADKKGASSDNELHQSLRNVFWHGSRISDHGPLCFR